MVKRIFFFLPVVALRGTHISKQTTVLEARRAVMDPCFCGGGTRNGGS